MGTNWRTAIMLVGNGCISCTAVTGEMCVHSWPAWSEPRSVRARAAIRRRIRSRNSCARDRDRETPTQHRYRHRKARHPRMTALTSPTELTFAKLGVRDEIVRALAEQGIERPFAIQELTL